MVVEAINLKIVLILTVGFAYASLLGYLSQRLKLSPIMGYLLAGYCIGPYSPGFVADLQISEQLAEIGVILMMFGVGLHFKWEDLIHVKNIAIPGAIGQTLVAATLGALLISQIGWTWEASIIFGLAIGVASTVVMVRVLGDNHLLHTSHGHVAIGWLIVEDLITVAALLLIPILSSEAHGHSFAVKEFGSSLFWILAKFLLLLVLLFTIGWRVASFILHQVSKVGSYELFTVTVLAITFLIATGSAVLFGTSIALGSFLGGMVIGQTDMRKRVSINAISLKDVFGVIFFLSIGMLFNPDVIFQHPYLVLGVLAIILIGKPLAAFFITLALRYPYKTALTVALALAQIGEFSFILSEEATRYDILPNEGYDIIVVSSLISLALNPLLFKKLIKLCPDESSPHLPPDRTSSSQ